MVLLSLDAIESMVAFIDGSTLSEMRSVLFSRNAISVGRLRYVVFAVRECHEPCADSHSRNYTATCTDGQEEYADNGEWWKTGHF